MVYHNHPVSNKIYAVIVTYNFEFEVLKQQHDSLFTQIDNFIYVDNNSINQKELALINDSKTKIIYNDANIGLAAAQNIGITYALNDSAEYILLFDQDSLPSEDCILQLYKSYKLASKNSNVAVIGPIISKREDETESDCGIENSFGVLIKGIRVEKVSISTLTEVSFCIASGSFFHRSVFASIGLMKDELFIDNVDIEWCLRAIYNGYKCYQTSNAILYHSLGNGSTDRVLSHSPQREYYIIRNSIWLSKKDYIPIGYRIRRYVLAITRVIHSLLLGRIEYFKAGIRAITDTKRI